MSIVYLTSEALDRLKGDLRHARTVERTRISRDIAEARAHGDLSENAEYDAAKDAQGKLEARIARMEEVLGNARVLDESRVDASRAFILSHVRVRNHTTGSDHRFKLVSAQEADLRQGRISITSPIGKALLGKAPGDVVDVAVPSGTMRLEVLGISREA